ncbi:conserved hypothetical protein [Malacoplasma penetrans HF-2]|uniref:Uncharacterized protein n=1 Tax=Malacoplasma penetrans (strain HF-2) TaxID=272633 RepID=Q8EW29_MALP2|nr:hypothetical protein [Malacoplasma penetrans]BAC44167.1 conserved hypothetical protein [Malacoplasma penetrans HF-2]
MTETLQFDFAVIQKFKETKIPWWILYSPIYGSMVLFIYFRSFFKIMNEQKFVFTFYVLYINFLKIAILFINFLFCAISIALIVPSSTHIACIYGISIVIGSIIFEYIYQSLITKWILKNIDKKFKKYCLKEYSVKIDFTIDPNFKLDINKNEIFENFKFNLFKTFNKNFIYTKEVERNLSDKNKLFYQAYDYGELSYKKQPFTYSSNFWVSFSNTWYIGMIYLLNSLDNILDPNSILKLVYKCFIKNIIFMILYLINGILLALFLTGILSGYFPYNVISSVTMGLGISLPCIILIHGISSKIINVKIKNNLLKDVVKSKVNIED